MNLNINELKPYLKNAKKHQEDQIRKIADSIKEFGFNQPIVVDKDNVIIVGHGRYEASKLLGLKEVPVLQVNLTEERTKAYRLADNKLNESAWDIGLVIEELKSLEAVKFDIKLTGFDEIPEMEEYEDVDFDNIESNEDREKNFRDQTVTCPECEHSFTIKI